MGGADIYIFFLPLKESLDLRTHLFWDKRFSPLQQQKSLNFWHLLSPAHRHFIILRLSCVMFCSMKCKLPIPPQPVISRSLVYSFT